LRIIGALPFRIRSCSARFCAGPTSVAPTPSLRVR
jgi:hypothetical protein